MLIFHPFVVVVNLQSFLARKIGINISAKKEKSIAVAIELVNCIACHLRKLGQNVVFAAACKR